MAHRVFALSWSTCYIFIIEQCIRTARPSPRMIWCFLHTILEEEILKRGNTNVWYEFHLRIFSNPAVAKIKKMHNTLCKWFPLRWFVIESNMFWTLRCPIFQTLSLKNLFSFIFWLSIYYILRRLYNSFHMMQDCHIRELFEVISSISSSVLDQNRAMKFNACVTNESISTHFIFCIYNIHSWNIYVLFEICMQNNTCFLEIRRFDGFKIQRVYSPRSLHGTLKYNIKELFF